MQAVSGEVMRGVAYSAAHRTADAYRRASSCFEHGGEVVGGVSPRLLFLINPRRRNKFRDTLSGEDDPPVSFMYFGMMVWTQQTPIGVRGFAVMKPVRNMVGIAPGERPITPRKGAAFIS